MASQKDGGPRPLLWIAQSTWSQINSSPLLRCVNAGLDGPDKKGHRRDMGDKCLARVG